MGRVSSLAPMSCSSTSQHVQLQKWWLCKGLLYVQSLQSTGCQPGRALAGVAERLRLVDATCCRPAACWLVAVRVKATQASCSARVALWRSAPALASARPAWHEQVQNFRTDCRNNHQVTLHDVAPASWTMKWQHKRTDLLLPGLQQPGKHLHAAPHAQRRDGKNMKCHHAWQHRPSSPAPHG